MKVFTIHKLAVEEGKYSAIGAGRQISGYRMALFLAYINGEGKPYKEIKSTSEVEAGYQLRVGDMNTSPIAEIIEQDDKRVLFRTQTSVYELKEEEDDNA